MLAHQLVHVALRRRKAARSRNDLTTTLSSCSSAAVGKLHLFSIPGCNRTSDVPRDYGCAFFPFARALDNHRDENYALILTSLSCIKVAFLVSALWKNSQKTQPLYSWCHFLDAFI